MDSETDTASAMPAGSASELVLAWLYEALLAGRGLEIAAVPGGPDSAFLGPRSLREALPARWSRRIRWLADTEAADGARANAATRLLLVALPEGSAADGEPLRIDANGAQLSESGAAPAAELLDFARAALQSGAEASVPAAMPRLLDRLFDIGGQSPLALAATLPIIPALARCLDAERIRAPGALQRCLRPLARAHVVPWNKLLDEKDWTALHSGELTAFLLAAPERLDDGERALHAAAIDALQSTGWQLQDAVEPWQRPADPRWWARLFDVFVAAPQLVPVPLRAAVGCGLSLDEIPAGRLAPLLAAELAQDALWRRRFQCDALAAALTAPGVAPILAAACDAGLLDLDCIAAWLPTGGDVAAAVTLQSVLTDLPRQPAWRRLAAVLVEAFAAQPAYLPEPLRTALAASVERTLGALAFPGDDALLLALLRIRPLLGPTRADLPQPLWRQLADATDELREQLIEHFLHAAGGSSAGSLVADDGALRLPWLVAYADRLLAEPLLRARLAPAALVQLAARCRDLDTRALAFAALDEHLLADPHHALAALIHGDAWLAWREVSLAPPAAIVAHARRWLTHPAHAQPDTPPSMQSWQRVMADLDGDARAATFDAEAIAGLFATPTRFPWVAGHCLQQIDDIATRCGSLGALTELSLRLQEADPPDPMPLPAEVDRRLMVHWRAAPELPARVLAWLRGPGTEPVPLPLTDAELVLRDAGERFSAALLAYAHAVAAALAQDPETAIESIERFAFWPRTELRSAIIGVLAAALEQPSLPGWVMHMEQRLASPAPQPMAGTASASAALLGRLRERNCPNLAAWLA